MVLASEDINIIAELEGSTGVKLHNERQKLRNRFDIVRRLGKGTYGKVHLAVNKDTGEEVAIKTIRKSKIETKQDLVRIQREIQIMSSVQHPHIIHIYEVFENKEKIVLVMEYASGGELYDYLNDKKCLDENEARRVFRQVVAAVYYCHKNMICHRDLKLENILLDENKNAKIADFGLSNIFDDKNFLDTFCGSPLYSSPEIVQGKPYYGPEVDCWSLGVLLYTLVYAAMPFDGSNFVKLVKQISEGDYYEPKELSDASNLIRKMLNVSPTKRANIDDICSDKWVDAGEDVSLVCVAQEFCNRIPVRLDYLLTLSAADGSQRSPADELLSDQRLSDIISSTESGIKLEDHLESDVNDNNIADVKRLEDGIELEKVENEVNKVAAVCENPKLMMDDIDVEESQLEDQPHMGLDDTPSESEDIDEECENLKDTVVCMKDYLSNGAKTNITIPLEATKTSFEATPDGDISQVEKLNRSGDAMNKISPDGKLSEITASPSKHVVSKQSSQVSAGEVLLKKSIPETELEESSKQLMCRPVRRSPTKEVDLCNNERRGSIEVAPLRVVSNYASADEMVDKPQVVFAPRDKGGFTLVGVKSEVKFDMKQGQPSQPALPVDVRQIEKTLKGDNNKMIKYVATVKKHCQDATQPGNNPERVTLLKITCTPSEGASGMTVSASTDNTKEHWGYNVYRSKHRTIRKYRSVVEHQVGSVDDESEADEKRVLGVERCDSFGSTGSNDGFEDNFESLNSDTLLSNLLSRTRHFIQRFGGSRIGVSTNSSGTAFSINSPGRYLLTTTVQPQRSRATALNNATESMRYRQSTQKVSLDDAPGWEKQQSQYLNYLADSTRPSQPDSRMGSVVDGNSTSPIKFQLRHLQSTGSELSEGIHCNVFSSSAGSIQPDPRSIFPRSSFREATTGEDHFAARPRMACSHHLPMDSSGSAGNANVGSQRRHRLSSQIDCSLNGEPFFNYAFMPGQHTSPTSSNYRDPLQSWDMQNPNGQNVSQSFSSLMDSLESPRDVLQKAMELCDSLRKVE